MPPNTEANLLLIQPQLLKTVYGCFPTWMSIYFLFRHPVQRCSKHGYLSDTSPLTDNIQFNKHSWMASTSPSPTRYNHLQMASLSPSPDKILSHPHMASLSPSPNGIFKPIPSNYALTSANFLGTLVSNLLLTSSRERQTCQSNSSGSRRLNRGNCCTPKFALSLFSQEITASGFS